MAESPNTGCSQTDHFLTALENLEIRHEIIECNPELSDTQVFCEHYGYSLEQSANVIVAVGKSEIRQFAACVLLATTRLDINRCVRKRMGVRRASFASPEETRSLTGMEIGGVTALGLPESLQIWVDQRVMEQEFIILGGGSRSIKLKISPSVFEQIDNATVVENLASIPD
jgi:prolyl-tRNA editing enzyme YbaK/EbsC (Cys-tRNA(Pro) deacylase)